MEYVKAMKTRKKMCDWNLKAEGCSSCRLAAKHNEAKENCREFVFEYPEPYKRKICV